MTSPGPNRGDVRSLGTEAAPPASVGTASTPAPGLHVAVDASVRYTTRAGSTRYLNGLLRGLHRLAPGRLRITELAWPVSNLEYRQPQRALKTLFRELLWAPWVAPRRLRQSGARLLHSPAGWFIPPPRNTPHVATLLDLALIRHPERFRPWHRHTGRRRLQRLRQTDRVITISRFTAEEAMQLLGLPARKLEPILLGCDFDSPQTPPPESRPRPDVPGEFFLFVGSLEPGKNLPLLKQVYALAAERRLPLPPLVVVGARWLGVPGEGAPPPGWTYLGHIPDAELVYLYRRALALLFPSKYEGFGFPVLEAMTLGCPVVCSRSASIPEVAGDAAHYAALEPEPQLAALTALLQSPSLRGDLVARGHAQARQFSWTRCAEETLSVYRDVAH